MSFRPTRLHAVAMAVAFCTSGDSSHMFASAAVYLSAANCAELASLPNSVMTDDVNLFLEDAITFECDTVTAVRVNGPYSYRVTSDNQSVKFANVRFDIAGGAEFTFNLANEEDLGTATFSGVTAQETNGGVFNVDSGSSATFMTPMAFEGNSVAAGYSGGAVYAGGAVDFQYSATFTSNEVLRDGDYDAGNGGAIAVGSDGAVKFDDFSYFVSNTANSGGDGGAMSNHGYVTFGRASYFYSNIAKENGDELGGLGGALYTSVDSTTVFERRTIMHLNEGSSGGALYNLGTTIMESAGFMRGNSALGTDRADGGHIYTSGSVSIGSKINFREGFARRDGGAVLIDNGGVVTAGGDVTFIDNSASDSCDDVYVTGAAEVCASELP